MTSIETEQICLFDMDGTLFDYEGTMRADLTKLRGPNEPDPMTMNIWDEDAYPWLTARMHLIKMVPGWWRKLPKLKEGWEIYNIVKKIGFQTQILTKGPSSKPHVWSEKVRCIRKHFAKEEISSINITEDKKGQYGRVLVDDFGPYMDKWLKHRCRGLGIMPVNTNNKDYKHENVVKYDGSTDSLAEVFRALRAAYRRAPKQHWQEALEK